MLLDQGRLVYDQNQHSNIVQKKKESIERENHKGIHQQNTSKHTSRKWHERYHHKRTQESASHHISKRGELLQNEARILEIVHQESKEQNSGDFPTSSRGAKSWREFPRGFLDAFQRDFLERKREFFAFQTERQFCFLVL